MGLWKREVWWARGGMKVFLGEDGELMILKELLDMVLNGCKCRDEVMEYHTLMTPESKRVRARAHQTEF